MSDISYVPGVRLPTPKPATRRKELVRLCERVQRELGLSDAALSSLLAVSEKTLQRRKTSGDFDRGEALHLELLGRVLDTAYETFADKASARAWLSSPVVSLDKQIPLTLLTTLGGFERVTNTLYRQADGMF